MFGIILEYFREILDSKSDPRVSNLYLMSTPIYVILMCLFYIIIVLIIGPKFMKNKKPYNLKKTITAYNIVQVFTSGYIFAECLAAGWIIKYGIFKCHSIDLTENTNSAREIRITYIYFLSKFTEFMDTIFFVLRKKTSQITFLHVYHHVSMPVYTWTVTKFYPGGSLTIIAFLNSFIHVLMYTYYLLAGLGPQMQKYLWWKKYLTALQLVQFITGTTHFIVVFFSGQACNISKKFMFIYIAIGTFFYVLFSRFYNTQYQKIPMGLKMVENNKRNIKNGMILKNK